LITIKLDITSIDDVDFVYEKQKQYSYAFRKLYKHINLINDKSFIDKLKLNYNLSSYELNCLKIDVKTKFEQIKTNKENLEIDIVSIRKEIESLRQKENKSKKEIRTLFKLDNKLQYKNKALPKDITFGGVDLLKEISYLSNDKENNEEKITEKLKLYKEKRVLPINYVGSLNDKNSNRYFIFDFTNSNIIYKPNSGKKINISYKTTSNYRKILAELELIKDSKLLPISVRLASNYICITFENELLTNYNFNKKEFYEELNTIPKDDKTLRTEIAKKYLKDQEERMFEGKNKDRYCAIDLNPEYIGLSVIDKNNFNIIHKQTFDLSQLIKKSNESSDHEKSIYLTNKRKFEISEVYKSIFNLVKHYKVSHFVIEDLNFKDKNINDNFNEFNRKVKNVWNLNLQLNLIKKHCTNYGVKLIEVNPVYSSFIGNILYDDFDAVNASIEICRRGMVKYEKNNSLFPEITDTIIDTVVERFKSSFPDVQLVKDCKSWKELYKLLNNTGCKYRRQLDDKFNCFSHNNIKSKVNILILNN
jgi:IS605 OrfB family transposase